VQYPAGGGILPLNRVDFCLCLDARCGTQVTHGRSKIRMTHIGLYGPEVQSRGKSGAPPDDPGNPTVDFHGQKRSNETPESKTDPDAKLARKGPGKEAKLSYSGNLLVENRNGLIVNAEF